MGTVCHLLADMDDSYFPLNFSSDWSCLEGFGLWLLQSSTEAEFKTFSCSKLLEKDVITQPGHKSSWHVFLWYRDSDDLCSTQQQRSQEKLCKSNLLFFSEEAKLTNTYLQWRSTLKWKHSHLNLGSGTFSCLELSIIIYSGLMSLRCAQPWSTLHTPHAPLSLSSHSMQVLSGRKNPMTYFPNLFQLLQAKNSLCNLNTFFSNHSNHLHGVLFSKEIKIHLTVCGGCYQILCFANLNSNDFGIWVESTGYIRTNNWSVWQAKLFLVSSIFYKRQIFCHSRINP